MKKLLSLGSLSLLFLLSSNTAIAEETKEEQKITGYARIDHDTWGLQATIGANHPFTDNVGLTSNIYIVPQMTLCDFRGENCAQSTYSEFDAGVFVNAGNFSFYPMVGYAWDWSTLKPLLINYQLYSYWASGNFQAQWWSQHWTDHFNDGGTVDWVQRLHGTYQVHKWFSLGPQAEMIFNHNTNLVTYLPIGGRFNLMYGEKSTLALFPGFDIMNELFAGRVSFIKNW